MPTGPSETRAQRTARRQAALLAAVAAGRTIREALAGPDMPVVKTVYNWRRASPAFARALSDAVRRSGVQRDPALRRPSVRWSVALGRTICLRLASGEGLRQLCRDPAMPDRKTIEKWRRRRPRFAAALAAARAQTFHPRTGRLTTYDPAVMREIYYRICAVGSLAQACAPRGLPAPRTVRDWARRYPDAARLLDEGLTIASEMRADPFMPLLGRWEAELKAAARPAATATCDASKEERC